MGNDKPLVTLDLTGLQCPAPLLGAKRVVDDLAPGQTMALVSDCPGTPDDLFAWSRYTGNEIVATTKLDGRRVAYTIKRGADRGRPTAHAVLDIRGVSCPGPIVEAKKLLGSMKSGETLALISNCPGVADDIADWCRVTGHRLLATDEIGPGEFEFRLQKA